MSFMLFLLGSVTSSILYLPPEHQTESLLPVLRWREFSIAVWVHLVLLPKIDAKTQSFCLRFDQGIQVILGLANGLRKIDDRNKQSMNFQNTHGALRWVVWDH